MVAGEKGEKTTGNIGKVVLLLPVLNACLMTAYLLPAVVVGAWLQSGHGDNVLYIYICVCVYVCARGRNTGSRHSGGDHQELN